MEFTFLLIEKMHQATYNVFISTDNLAIADYQLSNSFLLIGLIVLADHERGKGCNYHVKKLHPFLDFA